MRKSKNRPGCVNILLARGNRKRKQRKWRLEKIAEDEEMEEHL